MQHRPQWVVLLGELLKMAGPGSIQCSSQACCLGLGLGSFMASIIYLPSCLHTSQQAREDARGTVLADMGLEDMLPGVAALAANE